MKRKTTQEKKISGTLRSDRNKTPTANLLTSPPAPAFQLTKTGGRIYTNVCNALIKEGVLASLDVYAVTMFAFWFASFIELSETNPEFVQRFGNGTSNISGDLTALIKIEGQVNKYMSQLGLTPKARDLMKSFEIGTEEDVSIFSEMAERLKKIK